MKIKIILQKVKVHLNKNEIKDLLVLIERCITIEYANQFEVAHIHAAWLYSLKEIAIKLLNKNVEELDFDKQIKISLSEGQFMSLMELYQYGYPENFYDVFANSAYNKLIKVGVENNLIALKGGGHIAPLLNAPSNNNLLN